MATYTAITDEEIDQDSPITQTLMTKYRDNLTAVIEGDASAPKVEDAALDTTVTSAGTDWVAARIAGVSVGAIGTYAFLRNVTAESATYAAGATVAGSKLRYAGLFTNDNFTTTQWQTGGTPSGTWRVMGYMANTTPGDDDRGGTLCLRIS